MTMPIGPTDASVVPRFAGLRTFARLPRTVDVERVDVAILGAPFDGGTTFRAGSRFGPAAVRDASLLLRPYNPDMVATPFESAQVVDAGDAVGNPVDIVAAHAAIEQGARELHARGASVLGIGGDHSVSFPLLRAAAERHGTLSLVQFDAHTDTWDSYFGAKLTHGTMFRRAIEEGLIDPHRSVQVGLRGSLYAETDEQDNHALGFRTLPARAFAASSDAIDRAVELIAEAVNGPVYLTFDIDVLDPAYAPGTGTPEIGGLSTREVLAILRGIGERVGKRLVSADVVEISPSYDPSGITALAGANVAYHLISMLSRQAARSREDAPAPHDSTAEPGPRVSAR
jgi:agmatinase